MEFATEMVAKAALHDLAITEIPIVYQPDGRTRKPHLRTWYDGWRHLRFMLLLSPAWFLLYPGLLLTLFGVVGMVLLIPGAVQIGPIGLDVHTLLVCGFSVVVGVQLLTFWTYSRAFAASIGLLPAQSRFALDQTRSPLLVGGLVAAGAVGLAVLAKKRRR